MRYFKIYAMNNLNRGNTYAIGYRTSELIPDGLHLMVIISNSSNQTLYVASTQDGTIEHVIDNDYVSFIDKETANKLVGMCTMELKLYNHDHSEVAIGDNKIRQKFNDNLIYRK